MKIVVQFLINKYFFLIIISNLVFSFDRDLNTSIWVERHHIYTKSSIDSLIFYAFENNIKDIYLQVRSRDDALYKSKLVTFNHNVDENLDPLEYALILGDLLNIEIHAWINTYLIWTSPDLPLDEEHILFKYPKWIDNTYQNNNLDNSVYLSPSHPKVNLHLYDIVKELINEYPMLAGIHFDYIRHKDNNYGFNDEAISEFQKQHFFNPKHVIENYTELGLNKVETDSLMNLWSTFNQENITKLLKHIRNFINSTNSKILLSAAVKPNPFEAKNRWSQDWVKWINDGILDFIIPMNYTIDEEIFIDNIRKISSQINNKNKILMGIAIYNQSISMISKKIILSKYSGYSKICLFSYSTITNNDFELASLKYEYLNNKYLIED